VLYCDAVLEPLRQDVLVETTAALGVGVGELGAATAFGGHSHACMAAKQPAPDTGAQAEGSSRRRFNVFRQPRRTAASDHSQPLPAREGPVRRELNRDLVSFAGHAACSLTRCSRQPQRSRAAYCTLRSKKVKVTTPPRA